MNYIGAHIPKDKSIIKTINNIINSDGNALQLFVSNPRSIKLVDINNFSIDAPLIISYCNLNNIKLVIHSSYIINLAKECKNDKRIIDIEDCYWIKTILNELDIANIINAIGCIVHVGKSVSLSTDDALNNMKIAIKYIINYIKTNKLNSKLIIETPAGQGTELLSNIDDFLLFYNSFTKNEKKYLGICIDTAHIWSAGYELDEIFKKITEKNEKDILVIHLNNSKKDKGSNVDVHDELEKGKMNINDILTFIKNFNTLPIIILEKPSDNLNIEINNIKKFLEI